MELYRQSPNTPSLRGAQF